MRDEAWPMATDLAKRLGLACWQVMPYWTLKNMFDGVNYFEIAPYCREAEEVIQILKELGIEYRQEATTPKYTVLYANPKNVYRWHEEVSNAKES